MRTLLPRVGVLGLAVGVAAAANPPTAPGPVPHDCLLPNPALMQPFAEQTPVKFLARAQNAAAWDKLPGFWNVEKEETTDPVTGAKVTRDAVVLKLPLGIAAPPAVPAENPITVAKWDLGKKLYYDKKLSTNGTVSCATCHDPAKGFTDQRKTSLGINNSLGGVNAPTVINSAFHRFQFWDGRGASLEDQAQGPVGNSKEMFGGDGDPWEAAVTRLRADADYVKAFEKVFGHAPTRDAAAKAIAAYERTVVSGNSLHDRAEVLMRKRVAEEETGKYELQAADYAAAVKAAADAKDQYALAALGADAAAGPEELGKRLVNGRNLFFGKARCSNCHVGDNFTDNAFHNLGVGVADGKLSPDDFGRYARLPTGHKDVAAVGAFKTPGLRALLGTRPYMHDGSEETLEAVVEYYDRGGNANEFLDPKMRDLDAEAAYRKAKAEGRPTDPAVKTFGPANTPVVPFKLNLTADEKKNLVLFMKALEGDPVDAKVATPPK